MTIWANVSLMSIEGKIDDGKVDAISRLLRPQFEIPVRHHAALALAALGPLIKGKPAVNRLIDALNDKDPNVAGTALGALVAIGDKNENVTAALKDVSERKDGPQLLSYMAKMAYEELTGRKPANPMDLGLGFEQNTTTVSQVAKDSPAERAGLKTGDKLLALGDAKIGAVADLIKVFEGLKPGAEVKLQFQRGAQTLTVPVKLGPPPGK